jgi:hypothetical protein
MVDFFIVTSPSFPEPNGFHFLAATARETIEFFFGRVLRIGALRYDLRECPI